MSSVDKNVCPPEENLVEENDSLSVAGENLSSAIANLSFAGVSLFPDRKESYLCRKEPSNRSSTEENPSLE